MKNKNTTVKASPASKTAGAVKTGSPKSKIPAEHLDEYPVGSGKMCLVLNPENKFKPFKFGSAKAALILENIELIKQFALEYPVQAKGEK